MSLLEKLKASGSITSTTVSQSSFFGPKEYIPTKVHSINIAFSGFLDGGMIEGLTQIAGPSKHFKSSMGLVMVAAYLNKYPDAVCMFYDSEFGITPEYLKSFGIDTDRVLHIPVLHIEELKFDIMKKLDEIKTGDHVIIFVDSIGNLASKKEVEDAMNDKSVADMTRAKQLKGLFRMITPHFNIKRIPCIVINHIYMEQGSMYPKAKVSGGEGGYYSANSIFIVGRSQEKDSEGDIAGWNFTLNIEKSRYVKEKEKLPIKVTYDGGIDPYSGLLDMALESGHVIKPAKGWYQKSGQDNKYREKDTGTAEFWNSILADESFKKYIKNRFMLTTIITPAMEIDEETGEILNEPN